MPKHLFPTTRSDQDVTPKAHAHIWHYKDSRSPIPGAMIRRGRSEFIFVPQAQIIAMATDLANIYEENRR